MIDQEKVLSEEDPALSAQHSALDPKERARASTRGTPIKSRGVEWLLPEIITNAAFDEHRDEIFEESQARGTVTMARISFVAVGLLMLNYELAQEEAEGIAEGVDDQELADTVIECLLGNPDPIRKYADWVRSALHANGLDPKTIPQRDVPNVLFQLVRTGRAIPIEEYASICQRTKLIREMLGR